MNPRTPVLVGVAQHRWLDGDPSHSPDVALRAASVARAAADDTGVGHAAIKDVDAWVHVVGWEANNPVDLIARAAGANVRHCWSSGNGGEVGVVAANWAARSIMSGELDSVVVTGGTNYRTQARAARAGIAYQDPPGGEGECGRLVAAKGALNGTETAHGMTLPIQIYPMFENALRAKRGLSIEQHRQRVGALMSSFTEVASRNPYAWFPVARTPDEITLATPDNRMVGFPYTKRMNAILDVDLNASYIMMSVERAQSLGIASDRWVFWRGGHAASEVAYYASERPDLSACPSMQRSHRGALHEAGFGLDDIALFDFYSCFPVAVEMACEMLGLDEADPRRFTLTGGLPYAGGPGSAYPLHSLATMALRVREDRSANALITGNGMWLSKHSASVWSGTPGEPKADPNDAAPVTLPEAPIEIATEPNGDAVIDAYTVLHDRSGEATLGLVVGRVSDGRRFVAHVTDTDEMRALKETEGVGRRGQVTAGPVNTFRLA